MQDPTAIPILDLGGSSREEQAGPSDRQTTSERLTQLLVDAIASAAGAAIHAIDDAGDEELRDLAAAGAGFAIEVCRALGQVADAIERRAAGPAATTARSPITGDLVAHWAAIWREAAEGQPPPREAAQHLVDRVLDQLDVTALIRSHVDLRAIARDVDFNALVDGLDVDRLADRIDVSALARRIDVNELAEGIDLDALVRRLDLAQLASEVIEEIDLADLVRDAAADTTSEGVRSMRMRGIDADRAVRRAVDRALSRRTGTGDA